MFFGASAGVGKTYAMLVSARQLKSSGVEVAVGIVETHGRAETNALLEGLEIIPKRPIPYKGRTIEEFDIDAALLRRPQVLLVDELAHTNVSGSRHPKRWLDVEELLDSGIDVFTTLNVQHLESLSDIVRSVSGVRVHETVPDRLLERCDEVVLVDLPPEDLIKRLKEGKVYVPKQAEHAIRNFFRPGNLLALRELALRRVADLIDTRVSTYRLETSKEVWQTKEALLVCIADAEGSERIIRTASRLAGRLEAPWHVVFVETKAQHRTSEESRRKVFRMLKLAEELGAKTCVLSGDDAVRTLIEYARRHNLGKVIIGRDPNRRPLKAFLRLHFAERIARMAPELDIIVVARGAAPLSKKEPKEGFQAVRVKDNALSVGVSLGIAFASFLLGHYLNTTTIAMLFMASTAIVSAFLGLQPAVLGMLMNVFLLDYLFIKPRLSFAVENVQDIVMLSVLLALGLALGRLFVSLRDRVYDLSNREERLSGLLEVSRGILIALTDEQLLQVASNYTQGALKAKVAILKLDLEDKLSIMAKPGLEGAHVDESVARWCFQQNRPAGHGTDTLPSLKQLYLPLRATMRTRGVLVVEPLEPNGFLDPHRYRMLDVFSSMVALALERFHVIHVYHEVLLSTESDRFIHEVTAALTDDLMIPLNALLEQVEDLCGKMGLSSKGLEEQVGAIKARIQALQKHFSEKVQGVLERPKDRLEPKSPGH